MNFSDTLFNRDGEPSIPLYPFYGYDSAEELDKDVEYMKSLCPKTLKVIQREVDEECDKLEYEGSCMFDTFPDQVHLGSIIDQIYERLEDEDWENSSIQAENVNTMNYRQPPPPPPGPWPCYGPHCPPPPRPSRPPHPPRPDHRPDGRPDWLRDTIASLLYNEMIHRRRRHRSRKRWNSR